MSLKESYPKEWDELTNKKVPKEEIDEYLLRFVYDLLKMVRKKEINDDSLGDGWSIVINIDNSYYKLHPEVYGFLFRLGDYGLQEELGYGTSEYGDMLYSPEEVNIELKKVAKKLGIRLDF